MTMQLGTILNRVRAKLDGLPPPSTPVAISVPERDSSEEQTAGSGLGIAEGQSFIIDYTDSKGQPSRRRITVWSIGSNSAGVALLKAKCHERNSTRAFRVDRIGCCIDFDGEVFDDVPAFLFDTFGLRVDETGAVTDVEWREILDVLRPEAVLVAAMCHADGRLRDGEVAEAVQHLALSAERQGFIMTPEHCARLEGYLRRLRPDGETLALALEVVRQMPPERVQRLIGAVDAVMKADQEVHSLEAELLNAISTDLFGATIV